MLIAMSDGLYPAARSAVGISFVSTTPDRSVSDAPNACWHARIQAFSASNCANSIVDVPVTSNWRKIMPAVSRLNWYPWAESAAASSPASILPEPSLSTARKNA
eukprot:Amastigsp_a677241_113.p3 type:complete len:104 gc:universal Amastigsp_a677241_113:224-535(+)